MTGLFALIKRNAKLFFKDRGMFVTAMITPLILLVLYAAFLAKIYRDTFVAAIPPGFSLSDDIITSLVAGQLISSILATSCITVAFCSNVLMVQDKVSGAHGDLIVTPAKGSTMALGYYAATVVATLIVALVATAAGLAYLWSVGGYLTAENVACLLLDVLLLVLFGTALSSVVHFFVRTEGQLSAVGTIISAGYGFICGAYMPLSQLGDGFRNVVMFLPGTYGTSLVRNHALNATYAEMRSLGVPQPLIDGLRDSVDCNVYFFDTLVEIPTMYIVLGASILALIGVYVLLNVVAGKRAKKG